MNTMDFERQLIRLRSGELRLAQPGDEGLSAYAMGATCELRRYLAALEAGYREVCQLLDAYRANDRRRETLRQCKGLQEARALAGEKWSRRAALGYAAMAANQLYGDPARVVQLLELMEDIMDAYTRRTAEGYYDALRDEGETDSSAAPRNDNEGAGATGRAGRLPALQRGRPMTAPTAGDVGPGDPAPTEGGEC